MEEFSCRKYLDNIKEYQLKQILIEAGRDRLARKQKFIFELHKQADQDWNQTFFEMLFRMMDTSANRELYHNLAKKIPYRYIMREQKSLQAIEALLIGGSGLLSLYPEDQYISDLKDTWNYLASKYDLSPMRCADWKLSKIRPYNHPVLRLAQIAMLLYKREFFVNSIINCRTVEDVENLFCIEASEYWKTHFLPAHQSRLIPKRLGREKSHILGINLVVQMQYAYSYNIGRDELRDCALKLLETIPAENNRFIDSWQQRGIYPKTAADSQALLQISTEYCNKNRCQECFVRKYACKTTK